MPLFKKLPVDFNQILPYVKTGDIVLMKGLYPSSHIVEFVEHTDWSHSAIIILADDFGIKSQDKVLLWESNIKQEKEEYKNEKVIDVILGDEKNGPQLVSLRQRIVLNYKHKEDGAFAIRHLHTERTPEMFKAIQEAFDKYRPATFPSTKDEFLHPLEGRFKRIDTPKDSIFCSELVALTYQAIGLLPTNYPANAFIPADFSEKYNVSLLKRAWLGNEIVIDNTTF